MDGQLNVQVRPNRPIVRIDPQFLIGRIRHLSPPLITCFVSASASWNCSFSVPHDGTTERGDPPTKDRKPTDKKFFSIFSFATCGGYSGQTSLKLSCNKTENLTITASFGYPFRLNNVKFAEYKEGFCGSTLKEWHLSGDFSSSAEFYVTIAVLAFLYCIGALVLYLGFRHLYQNPSKLPLIDFIITVIFAFMWLCSPGLESRMGSLNISVAFGFLNLILWAGNAWFAYKETNLHTPPQPDNPEQGPPPSSMSIGSRFNGRHVLTQHKDLNPRYCKLYVLRLKSLQSCWSMSSPPTAIEKTVVVYYRFYFTCCIALNMHHAVDRSICSANAAVWFGSHACHGSSCTAGKK
ncbi:unnamed protein product [Ranitomeya imitator]|uniref:MARVEL domain-containing protein n=1 Tax=Ranitomeya imitator TaxID=111125 RepID=A0ABN9LG29_9NEOB|nr:unnamed protein product [Ranitomeya imitator]